MQPSMTRLPDTNSPLLTQSSRFPATAEGAGEFHASLDRLLSDALAAGHPIPKADAIALRTAVGEIVGNIVEHACTGLDGAGIALRLARFSDRVEVEFEDPGKPFVPPAPTPPEAHPVGGIGLSVVRASVDVLDYDRVGSTNHWRLVRRLNERRP